MSDHFSEVARSSPRQPAFNIPHVLVGLLLLLVIVHLARQALAAETDWELLANWGFVPGRLSLWLGAADLSDVLAESLGKAASHLSMDELPPTMRLLVMEGPQAPLSLVSYGLLHGSLSHLATNVLWLAAFGSPVARRLGDLRFLVLMLATSIAGALTQWSTATLELSPLIGASAAVPGATAAAARFVFAPHIQFTDLGRDEAVRAIPSQSIGDLLVNQRALAFIGLWLVANLVLGSGIVPIAGENASIAWQAHIGGFLAGLILFPLLDRPNSRAL
jgi:membrane associated rhomboid family serine protease